MGYRPLILWLGFIRHGINAYTLITINNNTTFETLLLTCDTLLSGKIKTPHPYDILRKILYKEYRFLCEE